MASKKKPPPAATANGEPRPARMAEPELAQRVRALEVEVIRLRAVLEQKTGPDRLGWRRIIGSFAHDPAFDEAMRLGREWRESLDRKKPSRNVKSSDDRR
jgi:hypothetical protein